MLLIKAEDYWLEGNSQERNVTKSSKINSATSQLNLLASYSDAVSGELKDLKDLSEMNCMAD